VQYENAKNNIEIYKNEFEEKEKQLKELVQEKQILDSVYKMNNKRGSPMRNSLKRLKNI
jgi:hypothetical protein